MLILQSGKTHHRKINVPALCDETHNLEWTMRQTDPIAAAYKSHSMQRTA
ncbi:hypothetical protein [Limnohabitans planktonicus]|nr:hypothetical protein [Limnohabitans planktonicus]